MKHYSILLGALLSTSFLTPVQGYEFTFTFPIITGEEIPVDTSVNTSITVTMNPDTALFDHYQISNTASLSYASAAEELNKIGLFSGVGTLSNGSTDFGLDTMPTRAQAVVMIIAMLGNGQEAINQNYTHHFQDGAWADAYIGYALKYGISSGLSSTHFGTDQLVTQHEFLTMLCKALGYPVSNWENPYPEANSLGLFTDSSATFHRGMMAKICHSALWATTSSGEILLEYLSDRNVLTQVTSTPSTSTPSTSTPSTSTPSTSTPSTSVIEPITEITVTSGEDAANQLVEVVKSGAAEVKILTPKGEEVAIKDVISNYYKNQRYAALDSLGTSWSNGSGQLKVTLNYEDSYDIVHYLEGKTDSLTADQEAVLTKARSILSQITHSSMTEVEKIKEIHDYIINNTSYQETGDRSHSIIGLLLDGYSVCEGYTQAFHLMCYLSGIESSMVSNSGHIWNHVKVDGNWYHIDVTWDDPVSSVPMLRYDYFLLSDSSIRAKDRSWVVYDHLPVCSVDYAHNYR